jgi:hypothetical protein
MEKNPSGAISIYRLLILKKGRSNPIGDNLTVLFLG